MTAAPIDLAFVVSAASETVRLAAEAKNIHLELDLNCTVEPVWGDITRLQQVVGNLLTNAVKFTPNEGRVTVQLNQVNRQAHLRVIDTGKGISSQFLPHVFEYFRQEDGSTTRKFGGLGLGLAIVRQIVELHGGMIQAESAGTGLGATFTLMLPVRSVMPQSPEGKGLPDNSPNLEGVKVLVVEDEVDTRELIVFILKASGASVQAVASAGEALAAFALKKPDILLSDIGMPGMDGYMLMRQIRALPPEQGGQVIAIALTAYAGDTDHQQVLKSGFQSHITKPVEPVELAMAVAKLVKG